MKSKTIKNSLLRDQSGFTLLELLIYTALTAVVVGVFSTVLVTVTRIQEHQSASIQVSAEMNTIMNIIKDRIRGAHYVSTGPNSLTLVYATSTANIVAPPAPGGLMGWIEIAEPEYGTQRLSSNKIRIDELLFTELSTGSSTAVQIVLTASASTTNPRQQVTKTLRATATPLLQAQ